MSIRNSLAGRAAVVTGAGRGIGRAVALALGEAGAAVTVASRTPDEVEETTAMLRGRGARGLSIAVDVTDWESVQGLVARTVHELGGVHVLVNNAGVQGPIGPLVDNDPEEWLRTVRTNLLGTFLCCKAVLPHMIQQGHGKIINLSGGGSTTPRPRFSAYATSKAGVVRFTETLAEEVREYGIQVNAIAPGAVNTRMLEELLDAGPAAGEDTIAAALRQRDTGGTPPELAAALVLFLASPASDGLTGKLISAPHDRWQSWDNERIDRLMSAPWLTLRRMDPFTLRPLLDNLKDAEGRS